VMRFLAPEDSGTQWKSVGYGGAISPDGKWLAYESRESGRSEVYVRQLPSGPGKWQISSQGGIQPRWSGDGRELFSQRRHRRHEHIDDCPCPDRRSVHRRFAATPVRFRYEQGGHDYAVMPDGQHFICIKESKREGSATQMNVV